MGTTTIQRFVFGGAPRCILLWLLCAVAGLSSASAQFVLQFSVTQPACYGLPTGAVTVTPIGGTGPYTYLWNTGATTATISNIMAGTYSVTVTGANGTVSQSVTVNQPTQVVATLIGDTCTLPTTITAVGSGGVGPYSYGWDNGTPGPAINITAMGMYCVTVVDATGCGIQECVKIMHPPISLNLQVSNPQCPGQATGQIQAVASGGKPPLSYQWSNGGTGPVISGLLPGIYAVTVTDARGCSRTATGTVAAPPPIVVTISSTNPVCAGSVNGSATASATGGTPPYQYTWSNSVNGPVVTNLGAGTYTVTVRDANNCIAIQSVTLVPQSNLTLGAVGAGPGCPGQSTGSATANPQGGVAPFAYLWSNGATTQTINNLAPGNYSVTVTDGLGCVATASAIVPAAPLFNIQVTSTNVTSCGANNGTATVTITQGVPPFTFQWSNGATGVTTISNLPPGTYTVTVTNGNGCQAISGAVITQPPLVSVTVTASPLVCAGQATGTATALPAGGTPPFTYAWSNGGNTQLITGLPPGFYTVTVTDAAACQATAAVTIQAAPLPTVTVNAPAVVCGAGNTATATATATGGAAPYAYQWSNGATGAVATGLTTGVYTVTATDANQCAGVGNVNINVIDNLSVLITRQSVLCFGGNTGSAVAAASGGSPPYLYQWSNGVQGPVNNNLAAGIYIVTVTDGNGCTITGNTVIGQPSQLTVSITASALQLCPEESNATLTALPGGGTQPYSFLWNTGATSSSISNQGPGAYSVTVTDANGCTTTAALTITQFQALQINITSAEVVCAESSTAGAASVVVSGGQPPYSYLWSNGSSSESVSNLSTGIYSVTATDSNGCSAVAEISILVVSDFTVSVTPRHVLCFGGNTGSALAIPSGGTPPYSFAWSNGAQTAEATNLSAGDFNVTVTESMGCTLVIPVQILQPPLLQVSAAGVNVSCFGGSDGRALATATGGSPPYSYFWSNGQSAVSASGLPVGAYSITVQDVNGCTASASVTIGQPPALAVSLEPVHPRCFGEASGALAASVSGGVMPYTYSWSTGAVSSGIPNLTAGAYSLTVTDQNGCTAVVSAQLTQPPALDIMLEKTNIICSNNNIGALNARVQGGVSPYIYIWSNGQTSQMISNLAAGAYSLTVSDANGCTATARDTIRQTFQLSITPSTTPVSCFGLSDGNVALAVNGGTPPYNYTWSNGANTSALSGLSAGSYTVTVTSTDGCTGTATMNITQPPMLMSSISSTAITCNGLSNGAASVTATGGVAPYTFRWSNGGSTPSINNLPVGNYTVTITDANGCEVVRTTMINQPPALSVSITQQQGACEGAATAVLRATASGGTGTYTYRWNDGTTGAVRSGLPAGTYSVTATDANGCTTGATFTIMAFVNPSCAINIQRYVVSGNDGSLIIATTGGTPPYTYQWNNGATTPALNNLAPGLYTATVTDANGCTSVCQRQLPTPSGVGDFVWIDANFNGIQDPGEVGIPGVKVVISGTAETNPYVDSTVTNANGLYFFAVPPGEYKLTFILPAGSDLTPTTPNAGTNDARDSDMDPVTYMTPFFVVPPGLVDLSWDAGFTPPCINIDNAGTIGPVYQFLCGPGNVPAPITSVTLPSGGTDTAPIEYIWMRSVVNGPFDNGHWQLIPGTNSPSYQPGPIYQTTYFARCARRVECGPFLESNVVIVEVGNVSVANISGPSVVCFGQQATFAATGTAQGAVIQWTFGPGMVPSSTTGSPVTVSFTSIGTFTIQLSVTQNGCTAQGFKQVTVTNSPIYCGSGLVIHSELRALREVLTTWELPDTEPDHEMFLEHSADSILWQVLAENIAPVRVTDGKKQYAFLDTKPKAGRNLYRVRYVSVFERETGYSNVEEVILYNDSRLVLLYPNPVSGQAVLEFFETFSNEILLEVVSSNGIRLQRMVLPASAKRIPLDFGGYPRGVYFLRLKYGDVELKQLKVVKM